MQRIMLPGRWARCNEYAFSLLVAAWGLSVSVHAVLTLGSCQPPPGIP
jgi:hypothetical protein